MRDSQAYLGTKSATIRGAESAEQSTYDDHCNRLIEGQTELRTKKSNGECTNMASKGPPEEECVEDRWRSLVFLVNAIDTLCLNAHLSIEPLLAIS